MAKKDPIDDLVDFNHAAHDVWGLLSKCCLPLVAKHWHWKLKRKEMDALLRRFHQLAGPARQAVVTLGRRIDAKDASATNWTTTSELVIARLCRLFPPGISGSIVATVRKALSRSTSRAAFELAMKDGVSIEDQIGYQLDQYPALRDELERLIEVAEIKLNEPPDADNDDHPGKWKTVRLDAPLRRTSKPKRKLTGKHLMGKPLTDKQREALEMLVECQENKSEAAARLGIKRASLDDRLDGARLRNELFRNRSVNARHKLPEDRRGAVQV